MTLPEVPGVAVVREGAIASVILDRPGQYNSISYVMWQGLRDLFVALGTDPDLRGVVLTGANGCFSSGADIGDFEQTRATPEQGVTYEVAVDEACNAIANLGCPVIAAIEGYCYGGACNLAMASDFRFVAESAKFSIPAAKLSIVYSPRGMARLVALVGLTEAKRIFYTAQPFTAEVALKNGFADELHADPVAAARAWLGSIAHLAPLSIAGSKAILNMIAMPEQAYDPALAHAVTWRALTSHDYAEGRAAFAAKRPPQFKGA
jgi:enoyl-CoA hydratase/carnithine racemase